MPTIRYEIRSEYGLADPELYRSADENDPEALLEGVAMAGLVGVLRQLGDLAEFASEIFHDLHEEVTATASRGHGLMLRVLQLEAEFPSIEKAFLSQTDPSPLAYNEGIDWHANLRMDQNLVTQGDMPRFILDSYGECRGPPRIFMLDKFDVAGAGACLKRYSDPSFFKVDLASSGMMEEETREKKARKVKKKGSRWRIGKSTKSFLAPLIRSNLQPVISEKVSAKVPMRHIKLKSRNLVDSDITNKRSYMEHLLEVHSPEKKVTDQVGAVVKVYETETDSVVDSPILKKGYGIRSPAKTETKILPACKLADQKMEGIKMFTPVPDEKIGIESSTKTAVTVYGYNSNEAEKYSPEIVNVDQKKYFVETQIAIADHVDDHGSAGKFKREAKLCHSFGEAEADPSHFVMVDQNNSFSHSVFSSEDGFDDHRSDDVGSELENYMDALNTMESEIGMDSDSRKKSDPGTFNMGAHRMDVINKPEQELPTQFSEPDDRGNSNGKGLNNMLVSSPSISESSSNLSDAQQSQKESYSSNALLIPAIYLSEDVRTPEEQPIISTAEEFMPSVHLPTNDTCIANGSEAMIAEAATLGAHSSSCVLESTSSVDHVCPQASNEALSLTIHPTGTFSGDMEGNDLDDRQLNGNMEDLSKYASNSETCLDELLHLSDTLGSFFEREDTPEEGHFNKKADEAPSFTLHPVNEEFLGSVGNTHEASQQLITKQEVSNSADNYDTNESLLSPELGGSVSASEDSLEEIHPAEGTSMDNLSLTQDCSSLGDAAALFGETTLLTTKNILHIDGEQKQSMEQEKEVLSDESISLTDPHLSTNSCSAVVKSVDLDANKKSLTMPENLAAKGSSSDVRLSHDVAENLDGSVSCTVHIFELLSQDPDGIEYLKPAASTFSSDDLLYESVVPERTDTAEDDEDMVSVDTGNPEGNSMPIEATPWCVKDPIISFTEGPGTSSHTISPATDFDVSIETSPIVRHPNEQAAKLSDDLLHESVVLERTDTAEDDEDAVSADTGNPEGNSVPIETTPRCVKDPIILFTEGPGTSSHTISPATDFDVSIETSPIVQHPNELAAKLDTCAAQSEDSINDIGGIRILMPNFLPLELEQSFAVEKPEKHHEMDSAELSPGAYINNTFLDGKNLQSTEPVSMVIGGTNLVADNLGFACGTTSSNLPKEEHPEKNTERDDSLDEYVIVETDDENRDTCSIYSRKSSTFDMELQEDYLSGTAALDSRTLEINDINYPESATVMPYIDNQTMSSSTVLCSDFPIVGSSHSSDAKLSDVCQTAASEFNIGKGNPSETEDSFLREHKDLSTSFLVEPAILLDGNKSNVTFSNQKGKRLEASDIQFEIAFSDEQTISQSNVKDIDAESLIPQPYEFYELDIPSSDARYEQQEADAVPSESTSEMSAGSMASHISTTASSSSSGISETGSQECLEPQAAETTSSVQSQDVEGTPFPSLPAVEEFLEPKVVEEASSLQLEDVEGTTLPPLPPVEWRTGKPRFGSLTSVGDTAQPPKATNPFTASPPLRMEHPQVSAAVGVQMVHPTPLTLCEGDRVLQGLQGYLNSESLTQHTEVSLVHDKEGLQHGISLQNPFLLPRAENERNSGVHDTSMLVLEDKITQHPQLLQGAHSIQDKRPQLAQLVPSLELERSKHDSISMADPMLSMNSFMAVSSSEEFKHQYGYGVHGGEILRHLNMSAPLPVAGPNMPPYGFLYPMGENTSMIYDFMVPSTEGERPTWKHRSIRDRPRNPLIEAVAAHDKSTLRKVSELGPPQARPKADERDSLLEQIRNKSFNLKPAHAPKPNMKGPPTNLKLAAILEKANAIRQAFVGSDEDDDDDSESWNDT